MKRCPKCDYQMSETANSCPRCDGYKTVRLDKIAAAPRQPISKPIVQTPITRTTALEQPISQNSNASPNPAAFLPVSTPQPPTVVYAPTPAKSSTTGWLVAGLLAFLLSVAFCVIIALFFFGQENDNPVVAQVPITASSAPAVPPVPVSEAPLTSEQQRVWLTNYMPYAINQSFARHNVAHKCQSATVIEDSPFRYHGLSTLEDQSQVGFHASVQDGTTEWELDDPTIESPLQPAPLDQPTAIPLPTSTF